MRWRYIISTGNEVAFPYRSPELGAPDHFHMSPARLAFAKWRAYQVRKSPTPVELISLRGTYRPLMKDDLPLIFLTRNSLRFVASFTEHYRKMGVTRFLCVDDRSTDGTRERLLSEEDVEVFSSNKRYREANGGIQWRESLLNMFGTGRWYLNVDCDEYFVYENMINMKLQEYTSKLKSLGVRHVPAPMIDLYPSYPLSSAVFTGDEGKMPWHVADCFDRTGYRLFRSGSSMLMSGGPRHRMIGNLSEHDELMKYPLLYVEYPTTLSISVHKPWPFEWNFSPCSERCFTLNFQ